MKALDPSSRAPSAPGPMTARSAGPQAVGQAVDQRRLGPDDHQVGLDLLDRGVAHLIGAAMPGLPGVTTTSAVRARTWASACSRPPLPTTQTFTARPHAVAKETNCSRPGPTPIRRTGTPICSDRKAT